MNQVNLLQLDWGQYEHLIKTIYAHLIEVDFQPDLIIAICRGGFVPATSLSHLLGCRRIGVIQVKRTNSDNILDLPQSTAEVYCQSLPSGKFGKILIVEDMIGYGVSYEICEKILRAKYNNAERYWVSLAIDKNLPKITTLENATNYFSALEFIQPIEWLVFPWEKKQILEMKK